MATREGISVRCVVSCRPTPNPLRYAVKLRPSLVAYTSNGRVEIDNNPADNTLRGITVGRKNWLFAEVDCGGERAAAMYTLLVTVKLNGSLADLACSHTRTHRLRSPNQPARVMRPWAWTLTA